jgi:hypothetical protein
MPSIEILWGSRCKVEPVKQTACHHVQAWHEHVHVWLGIVCFFAILKYVRHSDYFKGGQVDKYYYLLLLQRTYSSVGNTRSCRRKNGAAILKTS